jgi:hypothetical protein
MAPEVKSLPLFNLSRLSALNYAIFSWFTENIISGSSFDKYYMCIMKVMPDCAKAWFPFKNLFILFFFNFHFVLYWVMIKKKRSCFYATWVIQLYKMLNIFLVVDKNEKLIEVKDHSHYVAGYRFSMAIHITGNVMCTVSASVYGRYIVVTCLILTLVSQK